METMLSLITLANQTRQPVRSVADEVFVPILEPSVVMVHEAVTDTTHYERVDNDLLIHNDERVIQLSQFFKADAQGQTSDLVLGDTLQTATHVTFSQARDQAAAASADEAVVLTPQLAALPEALAQTLANVGDETLGEGQADVQVSTLQAEAPVLLADEAPSLSIDAPLAGDDVISAAEYGQALEITGTSTGLQTDDVVLVVLNGKTYSTAVEADGSWKVVVLAEDMIAVPAGVASIAASVTSASGAVVQDSHSVFVITGGVQVTIDELAGDGLLNAAEAQMPLSVTGSVNNASAGDEVVVSVLDREYTGVVDAQGQWSVDVPADIWQRLTDGDISVTATVTNAGGNSGSATREMTLDTQIPSVAINTLSEDDIVNAVEHGQALEVSGTTTGLQGGEVISVELDGQTYTSTVSASGEWSVVVRAGDVAALSDGEHTLTATVESHAGNPASGEHTMVVNTVTPTVTINSPLAGDGVIDATELSQSLEVSGTSTGLDEGSIVTIAIGEHIYTTEVEADGSWFLGLSRLEVSTFDDGLKIVSVSATNPIGNTGEATDFVVVNSEQGANFVVIDPITGDDQINAAEAASELAITGSAAQAPAGAVVTVSIGDQQYTGYVAADGTWSVPVSADAWANLADGNVTVSAEVSSAGSSGSATRDVLLDTEAPTLSLNPLAGDDIINAAEQQQALEVSGTTTGLTGGEVVTVELNGKSYTTTVDADGNWELYIGAKDVMALADGEHTVAVSVSDKAGNPANVERDVSVEGLVPVTTITIDSFTDDVGPVQGDMPSGSVTDDTLVTLNGSLDAPLQDGQRVEVVYYNDAVGGDKAKTGYAIVDGTSWTFELPLALDETGQYGKYSVAASVVDAASAAVATVDQVFNLTYDPNADTGPQAAAITIDSFTDDVGVMTGDMPNGASTDDDRVALNGSLDEVLRSGDEIHIYRNGEYLGKALASGLTWSYAVPTLQEGTHVFSAEIVSAGSNVSRSNDFAMTLSLGDIPHAIVDFTGFGPLPKVNGSLNEALNSNETLYVTLDGRTYSSKNGEVELNGERWHLQLPAGAELALGNYAVQTKVVDESLGTVRYGSGEVHIASPWVETPDPDISGAMQFTHYLREDLTTDNDNTLGMNLALSGDGAWRMTTQQQVFTQQGMDRNDYSQTQIHSDADVRYASGDIDRDGDMDLVSVRDQGDYSNLWKNNGDGTYTSEIISPWVQGQKGTFGGIVALDFTGDGYVDFARAANGQLSTTAFMRNNKDGTFTEVSANNLIDDDYQIYDNSMIVGLSDYNNDGAVDLIGRIGKNTNSYSSLGVMNNNADNTFTRVNLLDKFFNSAGSDREDSSADGWSIVVSDYNNDGNLDAWTSRSTFGSDDPALALNNGDGTFSDGYKFVDLGGYENDEESRSYSYSTIALGLDWDMDGDVDIAQMGDGQHDKTRATLSLNNGDGLSWTKADIDTLTYDEGRVLEGATVVDYDWDGRQDILSIDTDGHWWSDMNTNELDRDTYIVLRIVDQEGFNVFYGNTVNLYDSSGNRVATQQVNPSTGLSTFSTGLVYFYNLDPNETYSAELVRIKDGVRSDVNATVNQSWSGLSPTEGEFTNYMLTAERDGESHDGTFVGTGYNDIFTATAGNDVYDGAGGWENTVGGARWSDIGGGDRIDFGAATAGVSLNLSSTVAQNTGFNIVTLKDIESFSGGNGNDVVIGSAANNRLEGRGGDDIFVISNGGNDSVVFNVLDAANATGGNGADRVSGFTLGNWGNTLDADRIDLSDLLADSRYYGAATATGNVLDAETGDIADYLSVMVNGSDTEIAIDRDGTGSAHEMTTLVALSGVQTDLATLLANHQLIVN
ncbi:Ig-like domain-containing protein [Halomonas binhaiensis]|uniref:Ig-like domain-containing protein n=1 Tax=Halomonas binhaiensis TaxID=2562282 RepID=A0A5C1NLG8_9GAMM|nr:Ig-like domain-containing protein [Halomonas binhaiensis]QEM83228.1 Ig-like domain-containing protein [Halomonas binhaiensis]